MDFENSVTQWIVSLKEQDDSAAQQLYERYIERLKACARRKLDGVARRVVDEEDIANIALNSVFQGIHKGRFHKLEDRDDLWQILLMLVDRKATDQKRRQGSQKRGSGQVRGESALDHSDRQEAQARGIEQIANREPTPEYAAALVEEFQQRLQSLDDQELQEIAMLKMQGESNADIANRRGCTLRTVERKLALIRKIWEG